MSGRAWVRRLRARLAAEDGFTAAEFSAGVAFLIFPIAVLVMSLPTWVETQSGARLAAQQAARTVVTAATLEAGVADARSIATTVLDNLGIEQVGDLDVTGELRAAGTSGDQEVVTVEVTVRMPIITFPLVDEFGGFDHTVSHSQPVDLFRSTGG